MNTPRWSILCASSLVQLQHLPHKTWFPLTVRLHKPSAFLQQLMTPSLTAHCGSSVGSDNAPIPEFQIVLHECDVCNFEEAVFNLMSY